MSVKVKELKDDAIIEIKLNKSFYLMSKQLSYYLFQQMPEKESDREAMLKNIMESKYEDLQDIEKSFYTVTLLLAEIEAQAKNNNQYIERIIPTPGDDDYTPPSED